MNIYIFVLFPALSCSVQLTFHSIPISPSTMGNENKPRNCCARDVSNVDAISASNTTGNPETSNLIKSSARLEDTGSCCCRAKSVIKEKGKYIFDSLTCAEATQAKREPEPLMLTNCTCTSSCFFCTGWCFTCYCP